MHQVKRHKVRFMARLQRRLKQEGECLVYEANKIDGYPKITFRFRGHHIAMKAHRVFMILKHRAPLPVGFDVGHLPECKTRACVRHIELQHYLDNCNTDPFGSRFNRREPDPTLAGSQQS